MPRGRDIVVRYTEPGLSLEDVVVHESKVGKFGEAMRAKLDANSSKGGWEEESLGYLFDRATEELKELRRAVRAHRKAPSDLALKKEVLREAADVGNFVMMIADLCGGLDGE